MDLTHQDDSSTNEDTEGSAQATLVRMRHLILDLQDQNLDLRNDKLYLKNFVEKLKIELNRADDDIEKLEGENYDLRVKVEQLEQILRSYGLSTHIDNPHITATGATRRDGDALH